MTKSNQILDFLSQLMVNGNNCANFAVAKNPAMQWLIIMKKEKVT